MILDLTFVEFHKTKVIQTSKYSPFDYWNVHPNGTVFAKHIFGKRHDNKAMQSRTVKIHFEGPNIVCIRAAT